MRHVQKNALKFIEHAGKRSVSLFQRGLPIKPVFLQQVFRAPLLTGNVDFVLPLRLRPAVRQLHQNHFRAPQVVADGHHQNSLANLGLVRGQRSAWCIGFGNPPGNKRGQHEPGNRAGSGPVARCEPRSSPWFAEEKVPPVAAPLRQARRNLLPDALAVVFSGFGHGNGVQRGKQRIDALEFRLAFRAIAQMRGNRFSPRGFAIVIRNQFFLFRMFHSSVPIVLACPRCSTNGSSALRSFCTERKTVFLAALVLDLSASAISSIPEPPQCRITKAVRSAGVSWLSARRICAASWPLCARRSGEGPPSGTVLIKSVSAPSSVSLAGSARFESSLFFWRMRSIA